MSGLTCWPPPVPPGEGPTVGCDHCGGRVRFFDSQCRYCDGGRRSLIDVGEALTDRRAAFVAYHGLGSAAPGGFVSYPNATAGATVFPSEGDATGPPPGFAGGAAPQPPEDET